MDQKTLIVSCVEYYGYLKNVPANKVFLSFRQASILPILLESNTHFPEMDLDFYAGMIDGMIAIESDAEDNDYMHYKERISLVTEVVFMLAKKHDLDDVAACTMYYASHAAEMVSEDSTGYYQKMAGDIFAMIEAE